MNVATLKAIAHTHAVSEEEVAARERRLASLATHTFVPRGCGVAYLGACPDERYTALVAVSNNVDGTIALLRTEWTRPGSVATVVAVSGPFNFVGTPGGICAVPGTQDVLLAECGAHVIRRVHVSSGTTTQLLGTFFVRHPQYVHCNADAIAVSSSNHRVYLLSWADELLAVCRLPLQQFEPRGLRLLPSGGMVVVDASSCRLIVFSRAGAVTGVVPDTGLDSVGMADVEVLSDGSYVTLSSSSGMVSKRDPVTGMVHARLNIMPGALCRASDALVTAPTAMTVLPDGALLVRGNGAQPMCGVIMRA